MADFFGKGIGVAAGFDLGAAAPLDTRTVVADMEELQGHIAGGRAYEGMMIYVEADAKMYIITKGDEGLGYEEFGFNQEKFDQGLEGVEGRLDALEAKDVELVAKDTALEGRINTLEGLVVGGEGEGLSAILADVEALKTAVGKEAEDEEPASGLVGDMAAVEGRLDALEAINHDTIEQLAQKGVDDAAAAKAAADAAQGEVDVLEGKVAVLEAIDHEAYKAADAQVLVDAKAHVAEEVAKLVEADNGIKGRLDNLEAIQHHDHENKEVLDGITAEKVAAWDGAEANAKAHAEQKIAELVGSAPEALDTLQELAQAIQDHQDVYDTYVDSIATALDGKVDKVEGSRLMTNEEAAAFAAKAEVSAVEQALADAKEYAEGEDAKLQEQIDALKGEGEGSVAEQIGAAKEELQGAIDDAQAAADAAQGDVDALEAVVGKAAVEGEEPQPATGLFAEIAALKAKDVELQGAVEDAQAQADKGVEDAAAAQAAADQAQQEVDALEVVVGQAAKDGEAATGLFAEIAALKAKDDAIDEKDAAQDTRLAAIEEMMGLGGGEGDTSALEQFANDIAGLKSKVGQAAVEGEEPQPATGLFAEIAALKVRDGELQSAIDAEAQRADAEEKRIVGLIDTLGGRMDNAEEAIGQAQVSIQGLQDTLNANAEADGEVEARVAALETAVGEDGEEPTGLFAEIAAAQAAAQAAQADVDALEEVVGVKAVEGEQAATGIFAEIDALRNGVAGTFQTLKTEIKEDGMLYTNVGEVQVSATKVAVMDDTDVEAVLGNIFGDEVVEG